MSVRSSFAVPLAAVALLLAAIAADAQAPMRVYRIGFVGTNRPIAPDLRQALRDAGYVEGRNLVIEARFAEGRHDRLPELVADVLRANVDVLVGISTAAALAAKQATTSVPIVFGSVFDPVESGLVASLARPGGNITGATNGIGTTGKWLEVAREAIPGLSYVAVLTDPAAPAATEYVRDLEAAARRLEMKIDLQRAGTAAELDRALAAICAGRAQAMVVARSLLFTAHTAKLVQFAANRRLPAVYFFRSFVDAGGLMSYSASQAEMYRSVAALVDDVLKGAKPAELPVRQPTRFELAINLRTAKALRLSIPRSMLVRADHLVE